MIGEVDVSVVRISGYVFGVCVGLWINFTPTTTTNGEEFVCKVAKTVEEASKLIESGFEYVTEVDCVKLFRKRK